MGNNPITASDPEGDFFFIIPQISFSGGFSIGLEVGFGIPGVASISATGMVGANSSWSVQGRAAGLYEGYGSNGAFAGVGYQWNGISAGYDFGSGTASVGYGGGFGNAYAGSVGLTYGKSGLGFNAGASSTYMWGTLDPGYTAESGTGDLQGEGDGRVRGNTGLYEDETLAYNVMIEQTQSTGVETAAWLTDKGVLMMPIEYPGEPPNTPTGSSNSYYKLSISGKTRYAHHLGSKYKITGQIHTHPSAVLPNHGLSRADLSIVDYLYGKNVYTIGRKFVHRGYIGGGKAQFGLYGMTKHLLNGELTIIRWFK